MFSHTRKAGFAIGLATIKSSDASKKVFSFFRARLVTGSNGLQHTSDNSVSFQKALENPVSIRSKSSFGKTLYCFEVYAETPAWSIAGSKVLPNENFLSTGPMSLQASIIHCFFAHIFISALQKWAGSHTKLTVSFITIFYFGL